MIKSYDLPGSAGLLTATELRDSAREKQIDVMRNWFYANFEDPVERTPYDSAEGGYIYIWGGPYKPSYELHNEFGETVSEEVIDELVNELCDISCEWTKHSEYEDIDSYLLDLISKTKGHKEIFQKSIQNIENLICLEAGQAEQQLFYRLLYVNAITALETYLSDIFISTVENNASLLRRFVETTPEFKKEKVSYNEIFRAIDGIDNKARLYLIDVVWHRLDKVKNMFKCTLGVDFPEMANLLKAVMIRHDLVHRNGKKKDGSEHDISLGNLHELIGQAKEFVAHIDSQWKEKKEVNG